MPSRRSLTTAERSSVGTIKASSTLPVVTFTAEIDPSVNSGGCAMTPPERTCRSAKRMCSMAGCRCTASHRPAPPFRCRSSAAASGTNSCCDPMAPTSTPIRSPIAVRPSQFSSTAGRLLRKPFKTSRAVKCIRCQVFEADFSNPTPPYDAGPYWLQDWTTGEARQIVPGGNDLTHWFPAPEPQALQISSSRWSHELVVSHASGDEFPVIKHATQGDYSFDPSQNAWWNSYYWFDATSSSYWFLPWRVVGINPPGSGLRRHGQSHRLRLP